MTNSNIAKYAYKRGQSGNPIGRPKGTSSITTCLKKIMDMKFLVPNDLQREISNLNFKLKVSEIIALRLVANAMKGKDHAIDTLLDRIEGKVIKDADQNVTVVQMPAVKINGREMMFDVGEEVEK